MNIIEALKQGHNKQNASATATFIGKDPKRFAVLMDAFFNSEEKTARIAAWIMSDCVEKHPELVAPYLEKLLPILNKPVHSAFKRNIVRLLQHIEIPEHLRGEVANACFELLLNKKETIAVKAFSITVIQNIAKFEPDLLQELRLVLDEQLPYASAAIISRYKGVFKSQKSRLK